MNFTFSLILFMTISSLPVHAEIRESFSLIDLCIMSDKIIEAKYIADDNKNYTFIYRELGSDKAMVDTFVFNNIDAFIETNESRYYHKYIVDDSGIRKALTIKNSDAVIFFVTISEGGDVKPINSGYRVIKNDLVYYPHLVVEPGEHTFRKSNIHIEQFKRSIELSKAKCKEIVDLMNIDDKEQQKDKVEQWILRNSEALFVRSGLNDHLGWGYLSGHFWLKRRHFDVDYLKITAEKIIDLLNDFYTRRTNKIK